MCGISLYSRLIDYQRFREVADENQATLLCDMSHFSGLVAAGLVDSPFEHCDMVSTTVHKTLRGPRSGILFYRRSTEKVPNLQEKVEKTIFPGMLGGPHNHTISAMAACFKESKSEEFKEYQRQVLKNSKVLGQTMEKLGYRQQTGGTDNHMNMVILKEHGLFSDSVEHMLDYLGVTVNKFNVKGTPFKARPDGLRLGSPAMTTRGCREAEFEEIGHILGDILGFAKEYCRSGESFEGFKQRFDEDVNLSQVQQLQNFRNIVKEFSSKFDYNFEEEMI